MSHGNEPTSGPEGGGGEDFLRRVGAAMRADLERLGGKVDPALIDDRESPLIFMAGRRISEIGRLVGEALAGSRVIFRAGQEVVRVNREEQRQEIIKAVKFVSLVEDYVQFAKEKKVAGGETIVVAESLGRARAEEILASDHFQVKLPVLRGINPVKLPVRRKDGRLELLQQGYDRESGIYTLEGGLDYDETWDIDRAETFLRDLLRYFPWADEQAKCNQIAAMLTVFCRAMLPEGARTPAFILNANMVGSGKTRLAQLALAPVFGMIEPTPWSENKEEFKKTLDSYAQDGSPYVFFDDIEGFVKSNYLNAWLTSSRWSGRMLGSKEKFSVPLRAMTFITGNNLLLTSDMERRRVAIELVAREDCHERVLPPEVPRITEEWLAREENRRDLLSALYAHVRRAEEMRLDKVADEIVRSQMREPLSSFEGWSAVVPYICVATGWGDPLVRVSAAGGSGDPDVIEAKKLAAAVLDEIVKDQVMAKVTLREIIPLARRRELFTDPLLDIEGAYREMEEGRKFRDVEEVELDGSTSMRKPTEAEKREQAEAWTSRSMETSFGKRFKKKVLGLHIKNKAGVAYEFGQPGAARGSSILITRVTR